MPVSRLFPPAFVNVVTHGLMFCVGLVLAAGVLVQLLVKTIRRGLRFEAPREKPYPPQLQLPIWGEHKHVVANGIKFHYVERSPAHDEEGRRSRAEGKPPLMLCLHGFPECWYSWRHIMYAFSSKYRVVAPDLRGYGETQRGETSGFPWPLNLGKRERGAAVDDYSLENLVEDIRALVLALGETQCVLVSHDWGSMVAWAFAYAYPSMVSRMIVMNGPHPLAFEDALSVRQVLASTYIALFQVPVVPELLLRSNDYSFLKAAFFGKKGGIKRKNGESPLAMTEADLEVYRWSMSRSGALTAALNYYRNIFSNANKEFLARIGFARHPAPPYHTFLSPTLILWGEDDAFLLKDQAKPMAKYVAGGLADVVHISNCSHWAMNDAVEDVVVSMADFLGMALPPAYGHPSIGNLTRGTAAVSSSLAAMAASGGQKVAVNDFRKLHSVVAKLSEAAEIAKGRRGMPEAGADAGAHGRRDKHLAAPWGTLPGHVGFADKGLSDTLLITPALGGSPIGLSPPRMGAPTTSALKSPLTGPASTSASRRTSFTADDIATFSAVMAGAGTHGSGGGGGGAGGRKDAVADDSSSSSAPTASSGSQGGGSNTPSHIVRRRGGGRS